MEVIDSHCHLQNWTAWPDHFWRSCRESGLKAVICGGVGPDDWQRQKAFAAAAKLEGLTVKKCFGLHPWFVQDQSDAELDQAFRKWEMEIEQADAVGEIGLDFARAKSESARVRQKLWFLKQLNLANDHKKPAVFHIVKATHVLLEILKIKTPLVSGALFHGWNGSTEDAKKLADFGVFLGMSGDVLLKSGIASDGALSCVAKSCVFESDWPRNYDPTRNPETFDPYFATISAYKQGFSIEMIELMNRNVRRCFGF
jgi:TatD DNase family protein